ncbi:MAG: hypothetical protein V4734_13535 [Terriglobus sp.]
MAKDYQIDETETELILHVPPPNGARKVMASTITLILCLWYGGYCLFAWLASTTWVSMGAFRAALAVLVIVCGFCLHVLYTQLAAKRVIFERHVVGVDEYLLGIRVRRRWFSVHRVRAWIQEENHDGRTVRIDLLYKDGDRVRLVETLDRDLHLALVVRMQRKDFVYV